MPTDPRIRQAMAELKHTLQTSHDVDETLAVLAKGAQSSIQGVDFASISALAPDGTLTTRAATDPIVQECDQIQYDLREGPCYDAVNGATFLVSEDVATDARWPQYGPKVAALGVGAQMAMELSNSGSWQAALNLYAETPHAFSRDAIEVAGLFASHAALAMGFVRTVETFGDALSSRRLIGQAIGIVMERYQMNEDRAFGFLVRVSQSSNVKLREVAQDIVSDTNQRSP